jgi:hypothetical protein
MTLTPLARLVVHVLAQYLTTCPCCGKPAAAHVDTRAARAVLVRFVCPDGCAVDAAAVLRAIGADRGVSPAVVPA